LAAAAVMLMSSAANAEITVSRSAFKDYNADVASVPNSRVICDFDGADDCVAGYTMVFSGGSAPGTGVFNGSESGITAAPPGDTTDYASILGPDGEATLSFNTGIDGISFFMGSPDDYNSIEFFNGASSVGHFFGSQYTGLPDNGNQALGERITFRFNGENVTQVVFRSTQNSFELDRIAVVPEPATWAMMLMGFGGLGAMIRRRRSLAAFA
jgi:hypothetical protein